MDDDGFAIHSRRRGARRSSTRDRDRDRESFLRDVPRFEGTDEEFSTAHARRYGPEEGLGPDGSHRRGGHFPHGSDRERLHTQYTASTAGRNSRRDEYQNGLYAARREVDSMTREERTYYRDNTGGLTPLQHERLDPRAQQWSDISYSNATGRDNLLRAHPHGYHSRDEQDTHHHWAEEAYQDYESARDKQEHHASHRSYSNADPRRDSWGRPVPHRTPQRSPRVSTWP